MDALTGTDDVLEAADLAPSQRRGGSGALLRSAVHRELEALAQLLGLAAQALVQRRVMPLAIVAASARAGLRFGVVEQGVPHRIGQIAIQRLQEFMEPCVFGGIVLAQQAVIESPRNFQDTLGEHTQGFPIERLDRACRCRFLFWCTVAGHNAEC